MLLLLGLTVLLCGPVLLGVVRIPAALVVAPRMVRVRSFRAGIGRGLRVLRSKRDQRRRRQQYDHQNLFHKMSPQREFPATESIHQSEEESRPRSLGLCRKVDLAELMWRL